MSIFQKPDTDSDSGSIPVISIDPSKLYDIYSGRVGEVRLYEGVKIVSIRTFAAPSEKTRSAIGGYVELEAQNGSRMMIPQHHIEMLCEHGSQPIYTIIGDFGVRVKPTSAR